MSQTADNEAMVKYQFEIDDGKWQDWKDTVPRSKSLETRIIELIESDTETQGDPQPVVETRTEESGSEREAEDLEGELEFPSGRDREACFDAIEAATDYVREHGSASMREIVTDVMPDHPLGYDVPELEEGDRYRGSWWRKIVKPGLEADGRLDAPSGGRREWRWVGQ